MTNDDILHKLAEARSYVQTLQLHGDVLPRERQNLILDWTDRRRDLSSETQETGS